MDLNRYLFRNFSLFRGCNRCAVTLAAGRLLAASLLLLLLPATNVNAQDTQGEAPFLPASVRIVSTIPPNGDVNPYVGFLYNGAGRIDRGRQQKRSASGEHYGPADQRAVGLDAD